MLRYFKSIAPFFILFGLTGCTGLGQMKETKFENGIERDMAMVNFVRRSVFIGDGAQVEAWDGDKFIGTLGSGRLLQYKAKPGNHTFMVYVQGSWGIAKGELKSGKTYYLKFNMSGGGPVSLGAAKSDDPRIDEWKTMKTVSLDESSSKPVPKKYVVAARKILERVETGDANVTPISGINAL